MVDDLATLLDEVDAVWVCTWTGDHLRVVRAAVDAGVAVFCEKPLAPTMEACREIAGLLEQVPHQVDLPLRTAPVYQRLREEVRSGDHGRPMAVLLRSDQFWPITGHYGSTWRADTTKTGGGALVEHSIHDVDLLTWLLGDVTSVTARTHAFAGEGGLEDAATVMLAFDTPVVATLTSVWHNIARRKSSRYVEVLCEDALLWADNDFEGPLHVQTSAGTEELETPVPGWYREISQAHTVPLAFYGVPAREFLDHVADGAETPHRPTAATALRAHELVDAAYRSADAGGRPVDVTPTRTG